MTVKLTLSKSCRNASEKNIGSRPEKTFKEPPALIRVSKLMSERGMCSRREADDYIAKGWVIVNGAKVQELGTRAPADCKIIIAQRGIEKSKATILINKPIGYVSGQTEEGYKPAIRIVLEQNQYLNSLI
jgi:23S rRNA pseudouridine2604 synthase